MDGATPVTVGLVVMIFACVVTGVSVIQWLQRALKTMEKGILEAFDARLKDTRDDVDGKVEDANGVIEKMGDRLLTMVLAQSEFRTYVAENYMSKQSNTLVTQSFTVALDTLRKDLSERLTRLEDRVLAKIASTTGS